MKTTPAPSTGDPQLTPLLASIVELIRTARRQALRSVDTLQVLTCWQIGRHIVQFEQQGNARAMYGKNFYLLWQKS